MNHPEGHEPIPKSKEHVSTADSKLVFVLEPDEIASAQTTCDR